MKTHEAPPYNYDEEDEYTYIFKMPVLYQMEHYPKQFFEKAEKVNK